MAKFVTNDIAHEMTHQMTIFPTSIDFFEAIHKFSTKRFHRWYDTRFCKLWIVLIFDQFFSWWLISVFLNISFPSMLSCVQLHSCKLCSVKLCLFIVNIAGTSLTFINSSGSSRYFESGVGISFSKKSRFDKVFISIKNFRNSFQTRCLIGGQNRKLAFIGENSFVIACNFKT